MGFQQGLSGLNAASKNLDVIGNNIANANTYGGKASRAEFQDLYANALNGAGQNPVGIGTTLAAVAQQFTQGNISTTENPMDLAINGAGFFQVTDGKNPTMYSRNGQFKVDRNGYIVNNDALQLMGYPADATGQIQPGLATALQLPTAGIPPATTRNLNMEFNLDSRSPIRSNADGSFGMNLLDPKTYNNATSMTVYDAKGQPVALTFYFQRAQPEGDVQNAPTDPATKDVWNVYITANGVPLDYDSNGNQTGIDGTGSPTAPYTQVKFQYTDGSHLTDPGPGVDPSGVLPALTKNGQLYLNVDTSVNVATRVSQILPTDPQPKSTLPIKNIVYDFSTATTGGSAFAVTAVNQDGYAPGQLTGIQVDNSGVIQARYSNGQSKPAGQIELATFRNPQGLQPMGGNVWALTYGSGDPIVGVPGDGNMGVLKSGALEESNVDMTAELVNMVTAQRVYQANAQTIKTLDQVLQTLVNLR